MKHTPIEIQMSVALEAMRTAIVPLDHLDAMTVVPPTNWFDLLSRLQLAIGARPSLVVLDEFPWALETNPGLDGLMKNLWDTQLRRLPLLLVLVGSDEAIMERLFRHDQPLYGLPDVVRVVDPFDPAETGQALGGRRSAFECFDARLVTGGFPGLVADARDHPSIDNYVESQLARPQSALVNVAQLNLAADLDDRANARLVLEAIGADELGATNFSRIAGALGGDVSAENLISRAVKLLEAKGIIAAELPVGGGTKLRRYRIADTYLRLWFRFVAPQLRNIEIGRTDLAIRSFQAGWATWRGRAIEPLVRDGFNRLTPSLGAPFDTIETVGGWWNRQNNPEVDLVAVDHSATPVAIGSVKWRQRSKFTHAELRELERARSVVARAGGAKTVALCPAGVHSGATPDLFIDADRLLGAWGSRP